jgi:hypothetical protein
VYDVHEKINTFYEIYRSGIHLDTTAFVKQLNTYRQYVNWSDQYFNISSYFKYEQDVPRIEEYILNLPVFSGQPDRITWDKNFGLSFNSWNKMHYARSDLGSVMIESDTNLKQLMLENSDAVFTYQQYAQANWPAVNSAQELGSLPAEIKQQFAHDRVNREGIISLLSQERQQQLDQYKPGYALANKTIDQMIELGIMISGPPIKKQTLAEKRTIIKNFDPLIELYNVWATQNSDICAPVDSESLTAGATQESNFWSLFNDQAVGKSDPLAIEQSTDQSDGNL